MSTRHLPRLIALLALLSPVVAAPPTWWADGNQPIITGAPENNKGPANIGQAKWMVSEALRALDTTAPTLATQIRADLAGTAPNFTDRILDLAVPPNPKPTDWADKQKAPLLLGQLKSIARPFYNRINSVDSTWVKGQIEQNHLPVVAMLGTHYWKATQNPFYTTNGFYPWNPNSPTEQNKAIATIGQLKAVFSLRFDSLPQPPSDTDGDGLLDEWELANFGNLNQDANGDIDQDYLTNLVEFLNGTNPNSATDGNSNDIPDDWEMANTGKFLVYPPVITAELPRMQNASKPLYLWNDTDSAVNYSATVTGATIPGYSLLDSLTGGIAPSWEVSISATGTRLATISDMDDGAEPVDFTSFTFPFYGREFSQVFVSSNGLLRFGAPSTSFDNRALPDPAAPFDIIAPFWDDLNPGNVGDIFFKQESDRFIVQFQDVAKYDGSGTLTFQVVLFADGRIRFNYHSLAGRTDSCTVGIQGPGGNEGLTATHNSPYLQDAMTVEIGPSCDFLEISPAVGAVAARSVQPLAGLFRSFTLAPGVHSAAVEIAHDRPASASPLEIPGSLEVVDLPGTIALTTPMDGDSVLQGENLYLGAGADDPDGIANVGFFHGETLIAGDTTAPYGVSTSSLPPGIYDITARLTDRYGQTTFSTPRSLIVIADSDFDGMPDAWESANDLDPNNGSDAKTDSDTDGFTNLEESDAETNPRSASDKPYRIIYSRPVSNETAVPRSKVLVFGVDRPLPVGLSAIPNFVSLAPSGQPVEGSVQIMSDRLTIAFVSSIPLASLTKYRIALRKRNSGLPISSSFVFITAEEPENIKPFLMTTTPLDENINVSRNMIVSSYWNEPLNEATLDENSVRLLDPAGNQVPCTIRYVPFWHRLDLIPVAHLEASLTYSVSLGAGLQNLRGQSLEGSPPWSFTTIGNPLPPPVNGPYITATTPGHLARNVALNVAIEVTWSEAMNAATFNAGTCKLTKAWNGEEVSANLMYSSTANRLTIRPISILKENTAYILRFREGVQSASGISFSQSDEWQCYVRTGIGGGFQATPGAGAPIPGSGNPGPGGPGVGIPPCNQ